MNIVTFFNNYLYSSFLKYYLFMFLLIFLYLACLISAHAISSLTVIPQSSNPFGKPYSQWTADWWKWYIETPFDSIHQSKNILLAKTAIEISLVLFGSCQGAKGSK